MPEHERMEFLAALSDSFEPVPTSVSEQLRGELEDRIQQLARGEVQPVTWEQVEAKISETLARHR